jgi:SAM-dependent methyltransferase
MPDSTYEKAFDELADRYDSLIDWPRRLAYEGPFFRELFDGQDAHRVADVGCGTGRHAAMFHAWGLEVEGSDISSAMIKRCRDLNGENERLHWVQRSFTESPASRQPFDAAVCIGNSLALASDAENMKKAVSALVKTVRPGGIGVIQLLNLWSISDGPDLLAKSPASG